MRCVSALLACALTLGAQTTIDYPDFSNVANLQLNGAAAQNGTFLEVTPGTASLAGSAFEQTPLVVAGGFDMVVEFQITNLLNGGADGMALVFHNDIRNVTALGVNGGEMGYGAAATSAPGTALANALVIELDTWQGGQDLSGNEISIHTNGPNEVTADENFSIGRISPTINLSDGQPHLLRVVYVPGTLEVYLDDLDNALLTVPYDFTSGGTHVLPNTAVGGLNLLSGVAAFVGFTAGTGWAAESHRVLSWRTGPYGWQTNSAEASLDLNGVQSNGVSGPGRLQTCQGLPVTVNIDSTLVGSPWDLAVQAAPLVADYLVTPGGQSVNVDLSAPSLTFLNAQGPLPTFGTPFPGTLALPIVAPPAPALLGAQMIILDPSAADGFQLSQGAELESGVGGTITGPTGDDSAMQITFQGQPLCAPADFSFYGMSYASVFVNSNGRLTFGGADTDFSATVGEALGDNPMIGAWTDFNPGGAPVIVTTIDPATLEVVVNYGTPTAGLNYFGGTTPNSFQVRLDTQTGWATIAGLGGLTDNAASMFLGISGGNLVGATDPGAASFMSLGNVTTNATDMIYEYGTPGPNGTLSTSTGGGGITTIQFIPNNLPNYDWIAL